VGLRMKKTFGVLLIIFGCLFGCAALWSVNGYQTENTSDAVIISDCKDRITAGDYNKWEGDEALRRGWMEIDGNGLSAIHYIHLCL